MGGGWTDAGDTVESNNKKGYFTISGLNPSTTYTVAVRCRRTDSGLWSSSGSISITTRAISTITGSNFNLGEDVTVNLTQPRKRSYC